MADPTRWDVAESRWDSRLSVNAICSRSFSFDEDLGLWRRLGVGRCTLFLPKLEAAGIDQAVARLSEVALRVDSILAGAAFDLTDEATWPATRDTLERAIAVAARTGATSVQTTGGTARGRPYEWAVERLAKAIGPVTASAARQDVRIAVEPVRTQFAHIGFVHALRDGLALADQLDLSLVFDVAHSWWEPDLDQLLAAATPRIAVVQVADLGFDAPVLERRVPGDSLLPIGPLSHTLLDAGYEGPFELEILGSAIEAEGYEPAIRRSLDHLTGLLAGTRPGAPPARFLTQDPGGPGGRR